MRKNANIRSVLFALLEVVMRLGLNPPHQHGPIVSHHCIKECAFEEDINVVIFFVKLTLICRIE